MRGETANTMCEMEGLLGLYGGGRGSRLEEKPERSVGWCMELRKGSCETSLGVVIFQSKLVSILLKPRIALDLDQYYNIDQINQFFNFLLPSNKGKHYKEVEIKMNCEVLSGAC